VDTEAGSPLLTANADNLWPGNLPGLLRWARSFGRKGSRAVVESRDRKTLAASIDGRLPRVKRLMDLPMAWPDQWSALGLRAPAER
jgi:hypothetical protein